MNYFLKTLDEIFKEFNVSPENGLTSDQALKHCEKYGANSFTKAKKVTLLSRIIAAIKEPMLILLMFAVLITVIINIVTVINGGEFDYIEIIGISIAIILSTSITIIMEGRSAKAFDALNSISDDIHIKVMRDGHIIELSQKELVAGDICMLETGDKIPADLRIIKCNQLTTDESSLTGESENVKKDADFKTDNVKTPISERRNMIYSGGYITSGNCTAVVCGVGDSTEFGLIAKELASTEVASTPLQEKLAKLGKTITILGSIVALLVFVIQVIFLFVKGGISFEAVSQAFITSVVLIVASVPEGLPTIVAVSLAINVVKMAKENSLVKKLVACETIGSINIICSDKTGTLTENKMSVTDAYYDGNFVKPTAFTATAFTENIALNSTANFDNNVYIGNATECAMLRAMDSSKLDYKMARESADVSFVYPFSSLTKNMTTVIHTTKGFTAYSKGSPEKILLQCSKISKNGEVLPFTADIISDVEDKIAKFQANSGRVIALCHKEFTKEYDYEIARDLIESDMIYDGFVIIRDPLRREAYDAISKCATAGIDLKMLTGDNIITAKAIATELGILTKGYRAVVSTELEDLTDEQLQKELATIRVVARSTPVIKMRIVNALKALGNTVAVTGDGINDAPALKNADIGIAMGITGTEVSKEAAEIVLLDDSFATIVKSIHWGRGIYENFKRFIQFQLTVNLSSVVVVLFSAILALKAPFTALQLLWINIIMDGPPALTLGLEPASDDLLRRAPTARNASIVDKKMLFNIIANGLFIAVVFLSQYLFNFLGTTSSAEMYSVLFTLFVLFQLFNAFNSRILNNSSIFKSFTKNKIMLLVFVGTFILQFVITQFGGTVFDTVPLDAMMWCKLVGTAFSVVIFSEVIKLLRRITNKRAK